MTIDFDDAFRDAYGDHDAYLEEWLYQLEEEAERRAERERDEADRMHERI